MITNTPGNLEMVAHTKMEDPHGCQLIGWNGDEFVVMKKDKPASAYFNVKLCLTNPERTSSNAFCYDGPETYYMHRFPRNKKRETWNEWNTRYTAFLARGIVQDWCSRWTKPSQ
jgi:hypothetical protein